MNYSREERFERFAQLRALHPHTSYAEIMDRIHDEELGFEDAEAIPAARLIAAAPDMLAAARAVLDSPEIKGCPDARWSTADTENYWRAQRLREAVAKAESTN